MHSRDHSGSPLQLHLRGAEDTAALGAALSACLRPGLVIWLEGDLGAGKTGLVRGVLRALGHDGPVRSPTYTLLELYKVSSLYCYHFDFYRFDDPREFLDAGLGEYFDGCSVCFVEWPEKALGQVAAADLRVVLSHADVGRKVHIVAGSGKGRECLECLRGREFVLSASTPQASTGVGDD